MDSQLVLGLSIASAIIVLSVIFVLVWNFCIRPRRRIAVGDPVGSSTGQTTGRISGCVNDAVDLDMEGVDETEMTILATDGDDTSIGSVMSQAALVEE